MPIVFEEQAEQWQSVNPIANRQETKTALRFQGRGARDGRFFAEPFSSGKLEEENGVPMRWSAFGRSSIVTSGCDTLKVRAENAANAGVAS